MKPENPTKQTAVRPFQETQRQQWLASLLLQRRGRFLPRFALFYQHLTTLPRRVRRSLIRKTAVTLAGTALLLALGRAPTLHAATITVDGTTCTLVDAVLSAENDASYGGCDPGSGADILDLQADVTLTAAYNYYYLSDTGLPLVTTEITIAGNGHTLSRDTADPDQFRILAVSSSGDLTLNELTISGGFASGTAGGGAVFSDGTLTISNSTLSNNEADIDGGAVANNLGDVTITNSTLSGNTAKFGGGIYNDKGNVTISNSTISNNTADFGGGGVYEDDGLTTITNSTISGNTAGEGGGGGNGGGLYADHGTIILNNSTITGNTTRVNGGGIFLYFDDAVVTLNRSVVSGNSAAAGREVYILDGEGTVNADNYNLFGDSSSNNAEAFYAFTPGAADITATSDGTDPTALAAILETTLADNGGPTETHALVEGSPAIDAAPSADCTAAPVSGEDQRGEPRNVDGDGSASADECDSGAFEFAPATALIYLSAETAGSVDAVNFDRNDILLFDDGAWSKFFDGSDVGLSNSAHNVYTIHVNAADDIHLSLFQNKVNVPGVGQVFGHDILHYDGSGLELVFDGSDVGLTTVSEKLDALHVAAVPPLGCDAYYLISTFGTGKVPGIAGQFSGEDVLGFCETAGAPNTAGTWEKVLDGSNEGMPNNSTFGLSASDDLATLYLITSGTFNVDSAFGGHSMVYKFEGGSFSGPFFSAPDEGLEEKVDGLHVEGDLP